MEQALATLFPFTEYKKYVILLRFSPGLGLESDNKAKEGQYR
jgi:hypothetical protein